jgi:hypothetical protein
MCNGLLGWRVVHYSDNLSNSVYYSIVLVTLCFADDNRQLQVFVRPERQYPRSTRDNWNDKPHVSVQAPEQSIQNVAYKCAKCHEAFSSRMFSDAFKCDIGRGAGGGIEGDADLWNMYNADHCM